MCTLLRVVVCRMRCVPVTLRFGRECLLSRLHATVVFTRFSLYCSDGFVQVSALNQVGSVVAKVLKVYCIMTKDRLKTMIL
jgi:hypothetical protein